MAKVAFIYCPSEHWVGGKNYYLSLFSELNNTASEQKLFIFTGKDYDTSELDVFNNINIIKTSLLNKKIARFHQVCNLYISENIYLYFLFKKYQIEYLSHSYISKITNIKSLPWIPDFQHNYLPDLFKSKELTFRNKRIRKYFKSGDVLVSSKAAYEDAFKFFNPTNTVHIYRFKPLPVLNSSPCDTAVLKDLSIDVPFLFLPNQFWKHKNHLFFFEAISILKSEGISVNLACSGAFSDYRNPKYSEEVKNRIQMLGVTDEIKLLGMVERDVFNSLMKQSLALVNPSLFEGWSTTVEEGKQSMKAMLLSDIPVHREQVERYQGKALFFNPYSVEDCVTQIKAIISMVEAKDVVKEGDLEVGCNLIPFSEILDKFTNE